jgi:dipeptidase E
VLELTALPSIADEAWIPTVQETDALLVWGGDPLYLSYWMRHSGLADLAPSLPREMVYVGVSAGSMAATATFGETYVDSPRGSGEALTSEDIVFATPQGDISRILVTAQGVGLVDFALFRTWITRIIQTPLWLTQNCGPRGSPCQRTRSTTRPPSE